MASRPLSCPEQSAPVAGRAAVEAAVDRRRAGLWRLPAFATNADRRLFHKVRHVRALMDFMPRGGLGLMLGGEAGAQVASPQERAELARLRIEEKAGPEGENAAKCARFLGLLAERAERTGLPAGGLPAGACLVASIVLREARRAQQGGGTSQGGRTVGATVADGALFAQRVLRLPVAADDPLVEAAAKMQLDETTIGDRAPMAQAASLPLGFQLQLETLAADPVESPVRFSARGLLVTACAHGVRANDALNARVWLEPDGTLGGRTNVRSKDGLPLSLHAPAEGWLGEWRWAAEHMAAMAGRCHGLADYDAAVPSRATRVMPGVLPKSKVLPLMRDLCALPPLCVDAVQFAAAGITAHSAHGTGADLVRFLGERHGFTTTDQRIAGHWLRDRNAARETPARPLGQHAQTGAPNGRQLMQNRYTSGAGRCGERHEQLDLRTRLVRVVRDKLANIADLWQLPFDTSSWMVLKLDASP